MFRRQHALRATTVSAIAFAAASGIAVAASSRTRSRAWWISRAIVWLASHSCVTVKEHVFSTSSNTRLALRLLELVRAHRLALPDDRELVDELVRVRIVERGPGVFRVDHVSGAHDDRAVVVGMAAVHLEAAPSTPVTTSAAQLLAPRLSSDTVRQHVDGWWDRSNLPRWVEDHVRRVRGG
jgi:hypothetical protein